MADGVVDDDEAPARELRALARLAPSEVASARAIATALNLRLSPQATRGCEGDFSAESWTLRVRPRPTPEAEDRALAHELGHLALVLSDRPPPHDEVEVERVARALLLPRPAVARALAEWGWLGLPLVVEAFSAVPAVDVILRAAEVSGRRVVVSVPGERLAWPPGAPRAWGEVALTRLVRRQGRPLVTLFGLIAWPLATDRGAAVVLVSPEDEAALWGW